MTASLLKFPIPSRGRYSCRELAAYEPATVAGGRMVCFTPQQGQNNPARITLIARHPRSIIVRRDNDNRFVVSQPPIAGEVRAYCCNLTGLAPSRRGMTAEFLNFVGRFQAARDLSSALLKSFQESCSGVFQALKSFRGLLPFHGSHHAAERFHNDGKTRARPRNLTARDGNYAC